MNKQAIEDTMTYALCNGKIIREDEPCISLNDRGFLFGDAVFTTLKVVDGVPKFFEAHVARLLEQCQRLRIDPPKFHLSDIQQLILKNKALSGVWKVKIIVTGGEALKPSPAKRKFGKVLVQMIQVTEKNLEEVKLVVFPKAVSTPSAGLKTLSYLDRLLILDYAVSKGADEAIVLSVEGFILETAFSNIFWVEGQDVFIPDPSLDLLFGIELSQQIDLYKSLDYRIHFVKTTLNSISPNVQFFVCNAIKGKIPASLK